MLDIQNYKIAGIGELLWDITPRENNWEVPRAILYTMALIRILRDMS